MQKADIDLSFTKITSPIDGIAGIAKAQLGDLVGSPGGPELTTVSTWFNDAFGRTTNGYVRWCGAFIRKAGISLLFLALVTGATGLLGGRLPGGFFPEEDQGYMYAGVQLPDASSLQRTSEVCRQLEEIMMQTPSTRGFTPFNVTLRERMAGVVFGDLSWELDFFGRIRRATEAARAEFFASEENRRFVIQTLVADLARAYIELRALDLQLEISNRTVKNREESLKLVKTRFSYGWDSLSPVHTTENLLYGAEAVVPDLKRAIEQMENRINVLLGRNPRPSARINPTHL
jgi:hypothetical protein